MKKRNIKISTQLMGAFIAIIIFVAILGVASFIQSRQLLNRAKDLYEHPFQVREAYDQAVANIQISRIVMRDLILDPEKYDYDESASEINMAFANIEANFEIIRELYLGPPEDIENSYDAYIKWKSATEARLDDIKQGDSDKVIASLGAEGSVGMHREEMLFHLAKIEVFAQEKAIELYSDYLSLKRSLDIQRMALTAVIIFISIFISTMLIRRIREPLLELDSVIHSFQNGTFDTRSTYNKQNEFGTISQSFNDMAETIQTQMTLNRKSTRISRLMLGQEDTKQFFNEVLTAFIENTNAQMAAVYLLSPDRKTYSYFQSIGFSGEIKEKFSAEEYEGEFGPAISTKKIQYIKSVGKDTQLNYQTVSEKIYPKEIITIPIVSRDKVIAVAVLASVIGFHDYAVKLIEEVYETLCARTAGVLAYQEIKDFKDILEKQNLELDNQKNELSVQTTELMHQNVELDRQKNQMEEASRLKTYFLSNMSHELRTPLNSIIALSGVLNRRLSKKIPDEEYSYLEVIERNGKNLLKQINDILDISRIESGRERFNVTEFNVNELADNVVNMILPQAQQKGINLELISAGTPVKISCDYEKVYHVLQNVVANAVKFTKAGKVEVKVTARGEEAEITVADTGIGIPEKDLPFIFDEFRQADSGTSRMYGGSGLGLAIAKKYVVALGGEISAESTEGKGSRFTIILPVENKTQAAGQEPEIKIRNAQSQTLKSSSFISKSLNGKTILVVDDCEANNIQINDLLKEYDCTVLSATNAQEAYDLVYGTLIDVVILDLMMPNTDGFQVLDSLRGNPMSEKLPVIILTAKHIEQEEMEVLKKNNVRQLIQKGNINGQVLTEAIAEVLNSENENIKESKASKEMPKMKVLVVEDNMDNMISVKALLSDKFDMLMATNGEMGVKIASEKLPDLILMDINLPGMSGIEAFEIIRKQEQTKHIPTIALTASVMPYQKKEILSHGFDAFVEKPIVLETLMSAIEEVTDV